MDWESCLDNFSSYFSNSSQFPGPPQPRQEVLLPDFFWWHFYSLKHCPWPRTSNYKSLSTFWSRNTMLEAGYMKLYHVAAYLPDVGFLSLTQHVGAENCGGHSCWESTNQEHHSVEEHRWPGNNEVAVNHFVPGSHCMVKVSWYYLFGQLHLSARWMRCFGQAIRRSCWKSRRFSCKQHQWIHLTLLFMLAVSQIPRTH